MFGFDTKELLMVAVAVAAFIFGVPGAKDRLIEALRALFTSNASAKAGSGQAPLSDCSKCFAAWETLRDHAAADGNESALQSLTELLPQLFPAKKANP